MESVVESMNECTLGGDGMEWDMEGMCIWDGICECGWESVLKLVVQTFLWFVDSMSSIKISRF